MAEISAHHGGGFEILERLGGGGMAEVLLGRAKGGAETGFVKLVAIKRIHPWMAKDKGFIQMLLDEARIAANLNHINIAQTYDLRRAGETYYILMEYIHGVTLTSIKLFFSRRSTPAPPPMVAFVLANICAGLEYAHTLRDQHGRPMEFIHRDVSPENVMVSFEGEVKLIDFGIARAAERVSMTMNGQVKGKPIYMSPEQASGEEVDHRTDIYSAGLVLYEMLTLHNPLQGDSSLESMRRAMEAKISPPSVVVSGVPRELDRICVKALARDPEQRYASAAAMERELYAYLRAHPYSRQDLASWLKQSLAQERARLQKILSRPRTPIGVRDEDLPATEPLPAADAEPQDPFVCAVTLLEPSETPTPAMPDTDLYLDGAKHEAPTLIEPQSDPPLADTDQYHGGEEHRAPTLVAPPSDTPALAVTDQYHGGAEHFAPTLELDSPSDPSEGRSPGRRARRKRILLMLLAAGGLALVALAVLLFMLISSPGPLGAADAPDAGVSTDNGRR